MSHCCSHFHLSLLNLFDAFNLGLLIVNGSRTLWNSLQQKSKSSAVKRSGHMVLRVIALDMFVSFISLN